MSISFVGDSVQNFLSSVTGAPENLTFMSGGGISKSPINPLLLGILPFFIIFVSLMLKSLLIVLTYNSAVPALMKSVSVEKKFHPISFETAVMIAVLSLGLQ